MKYFLSWVLLLVSFNTFSNNTTNTNYSGLYYSAKGQESSDFRAEYLLQLPILGFGNKETNYGGYITPIHIHGKGLVVTDKHKVSYTGLGYIAGEYSFENARLMSLLTVQRSIHLEKESNEDNVDLIKTTDWFLPSIAFDYQHTPKISSHIVFDLLSHSQSNNFKNRMGLSYLLSPSQKIAFTGEFFSWDLENNIYVMEGHSSEFSVKGIYTNSSDWNFGLGLGYETIFHDVRSFNQSINRLNDNGLSIKFEVSGGNLYW